MTEFKFKRYINSCPTIITCHADDLLQIREHGRRLPIPHFDAYVTADQILASLFFPEGKTLALAPAYFHDVSVANTAIDLLAGGGLPNIAICHSFALTAAVIRADVCHRRAHVNCCRPSVERRGRRLPRPSNSGLVPVRDPGHTSSRACAHRHTTHRLTVAGQIHLRGTFSAESSHYNATDIRRRMETMHGETYLEQMRPFCTFSLSDLP